MKIKFISKKTATRKRNADTRLNPSTIYVRLFDSKEVDQTARTKLEVPLEWWDSKKESVKFDGFVPADSRKKINDEITEMRTFLVDLYSDTKLNAGKVKSDWLKKAVAEFYSSRVKAAKAAKKQAEDDARTLDSMFADFLRERELAETRNRQYGVVLRIFKRYELYRKKTVSAKYKFDIASFTADDLQDLKEFIRDEHTLYEKMPEIYAEFPDKKTPPKPRGENTIVDIFKKIRAFFKWCYKKHYVPRDIFEDFSIGKQLFGEPIFLTWEEVGKIAKFDLSKHPELILARDIFLFQSSVGCRISDLLRMTPDNIVDGTLFYYPHKTAKANGLTASVPLSDDAKAIVAKHSGNSNGTLFPKIFPQDYNEQIRSVLRLAHIDRVVPVLDPLTREEKMVKICDAAASHMARRNFIGNLYNVVPDKDIISSMSGHVEGSRAFARYRTINAAHQRSAIDKLMNKKNDK